MKISRLIIFGLLFFDLISGHGYLSRSNNYQLKAATPQEAVLLLESAFKSGDLNRVAGLLADPVGPQVKEMAVVSERFSAAKQRLLRAMDMRFGNQQDKVEPCLAALEDYDIEVIRKGMQQIASLKINKMERDGDKYYLVITVNHKQAIEGGVQSHEEEYDAIRTGEYWQLMPRILFEGKDKTQRQLNIIVNLSGAYEQLASEVRDGKYQSRNEAKAAAASACRSIVSIKEWIHK